MLLLPVASHLVIVLVVMAVRHVSSRLATAVARSLLRVGCTGVVAQLVTRPAWLLDQTAAGIAEPRTSRPSTHRGGPWNTWAWVGAATMRLTVIWVPARVAAKM